MKLEFYKCAHCGNVAVKLFDQGVSLSCCGEEMTLLRAGETDGAAEKHVPVVTVGETIHVEVGSVLHPMMASSAWRRAQGGFCSCSWRRACCRIRVLQFARLVEGGRPVTCCQDWPSCQRSKQAEYKPCNVAPVSLGGRNRCRVIQTSPRAGGALAKALVQKQIGTRVGCT